MNSEGGKKGEFKSLVLENVTFTYKEGTALISDLSLCVERGDCVGITGPRRSGKSTLCLLVKGLIDPQRGKIGLEDIRGKLHYDPLLRRREIGWVPSHPYQTLFAQSVFDEVAFGLKIRGVSRRDWEQEIREALDLVDLSYLGYKDRYPLSLSGGEQRRLAIASVIASRPSFYLFDEPWAGLDDEGVESMNQLFKTLSENGAGVIILTHELGLIEEVAGRVIGLHYAHS